MPGCGRARSSGKSVRVGNFVEVKEAVIERGRQGQSPDLYRRRRGRRRRQHRRRHDLLQLRRLRKHRTEIGKGAFIGSNSALVAPVKIGDGAYVGSGSVITEDVPADALALGAAGSPLRKVGRTLARPEGDRQEAKPAAE